MRCDEIMRKDIPLVTEDDSVEHVAGLMRDENVGFLPVVRDDGSGRLVGVVSDRDIVITAVADNLDPRTTRVGHIMTAPVITATADEELESAEDKMATMEVRRIVVVDDKHVVLGVVSLHDVAQRESEKKTGEVFREVSRPSARW